jgi:predicted phage tail protein
MERISFVLSGAIVALGLYMAVSFGQGFANPPTISGIAFMLIGIRQLLPRERAQPVHKESDPRD